MTDRLVFYQTHLDRVSRSFAFCIARLQEPLRVQVSLAYLLCRILDSVEDAAWTDRAEQLRQFDMFDRLLLPGFSETDIQEWVGRFPLDLPEGERQLLPETGTVLRHIFELSLPEREAILEPVRSMSRGMRHFAKFNQEHKMQLRDLREVNQYCFFVAGVVGEILTRLVTLTRGLSAVDEASLIDAFHFGLFLQKVNLLKDQIQDERSGRFLIPSRPQVLDSLREHAQRAIDYITGIPEKLISYRLFCGWSLFLGLASLPWIERAYEEKSGIKIPRVRTQELLAEVEAVVGDNQRLRQMFELLLSFITTTSSERKKSETDGDAENGLASASLYHGLLPRHRLRAFGF